MKKPLRILLILVGACTLLVGLVVGLAFTPGVQTWIARRAVAGQPGRTDIGGVAVGLQNVHVENIRLEQPGMVLTLPFADVEVPVVSAARGQVQVGKLTAKGWTLDLSKPAPVVPGAKPAGPRAAFEGIFKFLKLPVDLALEAAELEGDIILPQGRTHLVLSGGKLGAGRDGQLIVNSEIKLDDPNGPVNTVSIRATVNVRMDTPSSIEKVGIIVDAVAKGPQFPQGTPAQVTVETGRTAQGETYTAVLRTGTKELARFALALPVGGGALAGTWTVNASDTDIAPFALGHPLPVFTAAGQGTVSTDPLFKAFSLTGNLTATADKLGSLRPELAVLGKVEVGADFDLQQRDDVTRVTKLNAHLAGAQPVLTVAALQAIELNATSGEIKVANPAADLARINLQGVPLAWAQPFLTGLSVSGSDLRGEFIASARDGGFAVRQVAPLSITGLSLAQGGQPLLAAVDVALAVTANYSPQGWQADVSDLSLQSGGKSLLKLSAQAGQATGKNQPVKATGSYAADLPALLAQPAAKATGLLSQGAAQGNFTVSLGAVQDLTLGLGLTGLVAVTGQTVLPEITIAAAHLQLAAGGRIDLTAPVVVTKDGRKSDLKLDGTVTLDKAGTFINAKLTGDTLYIPDLMAFSALSSPANPAAPAAPKPPGPPWAGITGDAHFTFNKIVYSPDWSVTDLSGVIKLATGAVSVDSKATLGKDAAVTVAGNVTYAAAASDHYALNSALKLSDFDLGALLRAADPTHQPVVEARLTIATQLTGSAPELANLADHAQGKVELTSKQGIFRALTSDRASMVQSMSSTAVGLLGTLTGGSSSLEAKNRALVDITDSLNEIKYDQFNLTLSRDAAQNLLLEDLTLISPTVRLTGQGRVTNVPGKPLLAQPLTLQVNLAVRGQLAQSMDSLSLLSSTPDELGYLPLGISLPALGGTLEFPDTSAFFGELVKRAAVKGLTNGAGSLLKGAGGALKGAGGLLNGLLH